jgi:hypothetical protein
MYSIEHPTVYKLNLVLDFSLSAPDFESAKQILSECLLSGQIQIKDLPANIHRGDISGSLTEIREEESVEA